MSDLILTLPKEAVEAVVAELESQRRYTRGTPRIDLGGPIIIFGDLCKVTLQVGEIHLKVDDERHGPGSPGSDDASEQESDAEP